MTDRRPCLAFDASGAHCIAALLHGAACCATGECVLCTSVTMHLRRLGRSEDEIAVSLVRTWYSAEVDACPTCGFPPPPPLAAMQPLPRFARRFSRVLTSSTCLECGVPLPTGKRRFHSASCWREYVRRTEMNGSEIITPEPPRVYRVQAVRRG